MGYLDSLSQGMQSAYGGYSQLYKKSPYTQIGQTRVSSPMTLPLGQGMYGTQQELPTIGGGQPITAPPPPQGILETGNQQSAEDYLQGSGDWELNVGDTGQETWLPKNAEEGQWYQGEGEDLWFYQGGKWVQQKETYGYGELRGSIETNVQNMKQSYTFLTSTMRNWEEVRGYMYGTLSLQEARQMLNERVQQQDRYNKAQVRKDADRILKHMERIEAGKTQLSKYGNMMGIDVDFDQFFGPEGIDEKGLRQYVNDLQEGLLPVLEENKTGGNVNVVNFKSVQDNMISGWQEQVSNFMDTLDSGEVSWDADSGTFMSDGETQSGWVTDWMSEVVKKSYETGGIAGMDYIDAEGNLAPELQTMSDWFDQNLDVGEDYARYNRELAANAIASGKSLNSGYYSEAVADVMANRTMQVSQIFSERITKEMSSQYEFIANSMGDIMKDFMSEEQRIAFDAGMAGQKAAIDEMIREQSELLAASIAETNAARTGQIFSAIFTLIIGAVMVSMNPATLPFAMMF